MREWLQLGAAVAAVAVYLLVFGEDDDEGGGTPAPVYSDNR